MESPSLFEAITRFPGALIRFPSAAIDTLEGINALTERIDRLLMLLEPLEGGMGLAGTGVDFATTGIAQAVAGLQQAVGIMDSSRTPLSSTSALRLLAGRLGGTTLEVVAEEELDADSADHPPPVLDLDAIVTELVRFAASLAGTIPGVREIIRVTTTPPAQFGDD
jgi:hypothetical protein